MKIKKILLASLLIIVGLSVASCDNTSAPTTTQSAVTVPANTTSGSNDTSNTNVTPGTTNDPTQVSVDPSQENVNENEPVVDLPDTKGTINNEAGKINIIKAKGDFESVYATFDEIANATSYNAYVSSDNNNWTKVDSELTRKYNDGSKTYYRTDAVGLKTGTYSLKIVPVINGNEDTSKANVASNINVLAHDRSGFAWYIKIKC